MIKPDLVGSLEAAAILGMPRVSFNRWAAAGKIPVAVDRPGKTGIRLFNRADIEELAETRRMIPTPPKLAGQRHRRGRAGQGQSSIPMGDVDPDSIAHDSLATSA